MKTFLDTFKENITDSMISVTYIKEDGGSYKKFFLKDSEEYYNEEENSFTLLSFVDNAKETIKGSKILQFYVPENKDLFLQEATDIKNMFERYRNLPCKFEGYETIFFREDTSILKLKLLLAFGSDISVEQFINALEIDSSLTNDQLNLCKTSWLNEHNTRYVQVTEMLQNEIKDAETSKDMDLLTELNKIKDEYILVKEQFTQRINQTTNLKELTNYWHPLLLPAPEHFRFSIL